MNFPRAARVHWTPYTAVCSDTTVNIFHFLPKRWEESLAYLRPNRKYFVVFFSINDYLLKKTLRCMFRVVFLKCKRQYLKISLGNTFYQLNQQKNVACSHQRSRDKYIHNERFKRTDKKAHWYCQGILQFDRSNLIFILKPHEEVISLTRIH